MSKFKLIPYCILSDGNCIHRAVFRTAVVIALLVTAVVCYSKTNEAPRLKPIPRDPVAHSARIVEKAVPSVATDPEAKVFERVKIQDGSANLLREINCHAKGQTVAAVLVSICDTLEIRGQISSAAEPVGLKVVDLEIGDVSGAQALESLAAKAELKLEIHNGEIVLEMPNELPMIRSSNEEF